jgi:ATP-dependent DNA ligase
VAVEVAADERQPFSVLLRVAPATPLPQPMVTRSGSIPRRGDRAYEVKWDGFQAIVSTEAGRW